MDDRQDPDFSVPKVINGLAALDSDGLVLLDLPGEWWGIPRPRLEAARHQARLP